ncbi:hypothetical protein ASE73_02490 [Sphingomonas sp. Leaf24]|uniref:hypothetical protein n=1 Tax=unclassified Sphingomonas TaxID=196159 RepID=UPI0006FF3D28|nr:MULTISPECIES: hypothetical protein [unclassified Sphingomonas]KQM23111.1 hypothetical protein ASE50_02490 [Sphingomonas sp. Leaf5]KQM95969.1 hypothetical protein ASE73_02490 [Sphingomonas sp. Leaf24]
MKRTHAPIVAIFTALTVALVIALLPVWRIEAAVEASGLPALLPAAAPPLGMTARVALMLAAATLIAGPLWIGLWLLLPAKRKRRRADAEPSVRRADAHPDAPPRPPVRAARDLGKPFLDPLDPVETEMDLPRDLNIPMAVFDPAAVPQVPAAPAQAVRPLFRPTPAPADDATVDPAAFFEPPVAAAAEQEAPVPPTPIEPAAPAKPTVELPEDVAPPAPPVVAVEPEPAANIEPEREPEPEVASEPEIAPEPEAVTHQPDIAPAEKRPVEPAPLPSLDALLDRLDEGLQRRRTAETARQEAAKAQSTGLASALGALRRMAGGE